MIFCMLIMIMYKHVKGHLITLHMIYGLSNRVITQGLSP
jgi:hypothetical protein